MDLSRFLHELTKKTNRVQNVRVSDGDIYQLVQQSMIAISIIKEWR